MGKIEFIPFHGCWEWIGSKPPSGYGYGSFNLCGQTQNAHRAAWRLFRGDPGSLYVLHQCNRPSCVNPDHLSLGTQKQNIQYASECGRMRGQNKTHCERGHEFTPENTVHKAIAGQRECRVCKNAAKRARWKRSPEARAKQLVQQRERYRVLMQDPAYRKRASERQRATMARKRASHSKT